LKRIEGDIGEEQECPVCFDLAADRKTFVQLYNILENIIDTIIIKLAVVTQCGHFFCNQCITDYLKSQNSENTCPICRADLSEVIIYLFIYELLILSSNFSTLTKKGSICYT